MKKESVDLKDRLKKLNELKEEGLIIEEKYNS